MPEHAARGVGNAQEYYGVRPDLAALGGGYPIGAVVGRADVLDLVREDRVGQERYVWLTSSLGGNPVSAAATLMTLAELLTIGERASNLKRMYNVRLGQSRKDDVLPRRILHEQLPDGGAGKYTPPFEAILDEYYAARGWDADCIPTPETLRRLGLEWTIPDLPGTSARAAAPVR